MPRIPPLGLLSGRTVTVLTPKTTYDEHNEPVTEWEPTTVDNVLVAPGSTSDVTDASRPSGTRVDVTFGFPKTFSARLRGCRVEVGERTYSIVGDPVPNMAENCPTEWWYTAEGVAVDG
jgi:hypothetical protein